ncbi:hypothetical protein J1614_004741 [Plenodomus biglobosus]|nr:hypothetical protein J1614_004741 [Plenodomus biglobosus]
MASTCQRVDQGLLAAHGGCLHLVRVNEGEQLATNCLQQHKRAASDCRRAVGLPMFTVDSPCPRCRRAQYCASSSQQGKGGSGEGARHDGGTVSNAGPQSLSSGVGRDARDKSQHPVLIGEHFNRNAWQGACVTAQGGRSHQEKTSAGTQDTAWSHVSMSE